MDGESTDEAIVGVKLVADEYAVTYLRAKLPESDREVGADVLHTDRTTRS